MNNFDCFIPDWPSTAVTHRQILSVYYFVVLSSLLRSVNFSFESQRDSSCSVNGSKVYALSSFNLLNVVLWYWPIAALFEVLDENLQKRTLYSCTIKVLTCFVVLYCYRRLKYLKDRLSVFQISFCGASSSREVIYYASSIKEAGISAAILSAWFG